MLAKNEPPPTWVLASVVDSHAVASVPDVKFEPPCKVILNLKLSALSSVSLPVVSPGNAKTWWVNDVAVVNCCLMCLELSVSINPAVYAVSYTHLRAHET